MITLAFVLIFILFVYVIGLHFSTRSWIPERREKPIKQAPKPGLPEWSHTTTTTTTETPVAVPQMAVEPRCHNCGKVVGDEAEIGSETYMDVPLAGKMTPVVLLTCEDCVRAQANH